MNTRWLWLLGALALGPAVLRADLQLAPLFRDHAVVQCELPVAVWGRSQPGETVTIAYLDQSATVQADRDGRWRATLGPFAPGRSGDLVASTAERRLEVHDVITGEVWLCLGQSNMQMHVRDANGAAETIAAANDPGLRQFKALIQTAPTPVESLNGEWTAASSATVGDFSAVAYYFGRDVRARLKRPIGLVVVTKGGTPIESWLSSEIIHSTPEAQALLRHWEDDLVRQPTSLPSKARPPFEAIEFSMSVVGPGGYAEPGVIYNGMLAPVVPYAVRGILWYQGETNLPRQFVQPADYGPWFHRVIADLRAKWKRELPFYFVQLPANAMPERDFTGHQWSTMRAAQASALALPATGMAVTLDLGEPHQIHPPVKQPVGARLALLALRRTYGFEDVVDHAPGFQHAEVRGETIRLKFDGPLFTHDGHAPAGLEWAGSDGHYQSAKARLDGTEIVLEVGAGAAQVRYAWAQNPAEANLCGETGLPVAPFAVSL